MDSSLAAHHYPTSTKGSPGASPQIGLSQLWHSVDAAKRDQWQMVLDEALQMWAACLTTSVSHNCLKPGCLSCGSWGYIDSCWLISAASCIIHHSLLKANLTSQRYGVFKILTTTNLPARQSCATMYNLTQQKNTTNTHKTLMNLFLLKAICRVER